MMGRGYGQTWGIGTVESLFLLLAGLFMFFVLAGLALIVVYIAKTAARGPSRPSGYGQAMPQQYPQRPYVGHRGPAGVHPPHPSGVSETMQDRRSSEARATLEPAYDIVRERYARGEISREEYEEIVRTLGDRTIT